MDTLRNVPQYIAWHIRIFLSQFVAIRCAYGPKFRQNFTCIYWFFQFFLILWRCKIFLKLWREYQLCFTKCQVFLTTCECWFSCNTALNFLGMAAKSAIGRYLDIVEFSNWRFYRPLDGVYCSTLPLLYLYHTFSLSLVARHFYQPLPLPLPLLYLYPYFTFTLTLRSL